MSSQVFYRKWRPQTLSELVGQPHVTQTLLNALKNGNISHAYLFCGPRGTGKTSTGRILAKAINCLSNGKGEPCNTCEMCKAVTEDRALDVIEIDAASNRSIDDIRDLREKVNYAPMQARRKVYIIDEFHMLSKDASNALLKTLEEPPSHVIFVLATTESHKVLPTILSRCQHFDFHRLSRVDVVSKLTEVCAAEKINIEAQSLHLIARSTTGSLRDAENLLEQLATYYGAEIKFPQVQAMLGITGDWRAKEIVKHIINDDISGGMATLNSINNDGLDLRQFNRELVEYLRGLLLVKTGAAEAVDLTPEDITELKELANKASLPQILNSVKLFGQIEMANNDCSTLPLELALVDCYLSHSHQAALPNKPETVIQPPPKAVTPEVMPSRPQPQPPAPVPPGPAPVSVTHLVRENSPGLSSEIERLKLNWKQVIEGNDPSVKKSRAVAWLKSGGRPLKIEDNTVVLAFEKSIFKENIEKSENLRIVEKIVSDYLEHPCKILCVLEERKDPLVDKLKKMGAKVTSVEEK